MLQSNFFVFFRGIISRKFDRRIDWLQIFVFSGFPCSELSVIPSPFFPFLFQIFFDYSHLILHNFSSIFPGSLIFPSKFYAFINISINISGTSRFYNTTTTLKIFFSFFSPLNFSILISVNLDFSNRWEVTGCSSSRNLNIFSNSSSILSKSGDAHNTCGTIWEISSKKACIFGIKYCTRGLYYNINCSLSNCRLFATFWIILATNNKTPPLKVHQY